MKKLVFTMAALAIAGASFAQTTFGVKVGPNFSSMTQKSDGDKETSKMMVGVAGGVYANLPIAPEFYIQPSLMYEGKGGKNTTEGDVGSASIKTRLNYLTLPIDLLFKPEMPNGSGAWIVGVGPYFGYGISGKTKFSGEIGGEEASQSYDPFKSDLAGGDADLKRFDAGANVQLGYEMAGGFNITLNANMGLINLINDGDSKNSARNTSFGVNLGYTFGRY